jgi:hypothetical protein
MPFVSSLEKTNGYGFKTKLSENKKVLVDTVCAFT